MYDVVNCGRDYSDDLVGAWLQESFGVYQEIEDEDYSLAGWQDGRIRCCLKSTMFSATCLQLTFSTLSHLRPCEGDPQTPMLLRTVYCYWRALRSTEGGRWDGEDGQRVFVQALGFGVELGRMPLSDDGMAHDFENAGGMLQDAATRTLTACSLRSTVKAMRRSCIGGCWHTALGVGVISRSLRRALKAYPMLRVLIDQAGNVEGDSLHEHVRALADGPAAGLGSSSGPRDLEVRAGRSLYLVRIWRRRASRSRLLKQGPHGTPLYREDVARALRERWRRVFAGVDTSGAQENRFLAHVPSDQLGVVELSLQFVSDALMCRLEATPGPDGLRYAAWAAAGPRFEGALSAYLRCVWSGEGLSPPHRVAMTCLLPKDAWVEGVMESAASLPTSRLNTRTPCTA